jgi:hypothetical protein
MRCSHCGVEMHLMHVVQDDTKPVPGYEHRTFMCAACGEIERRLVFTRKNRQGHTEETVVHTALPNSPAPANQTERISVSGILTRLFTNLRGWQADAIRFAERLSVPAKSPMSVPAEPMSLLTAPTNLFPAEPVPIPTNAYSSVPSKAFNDLDELEPLIRRAAEISPRPVRRSRRRGFQHLQRNLRVWRRSIQRRLRPTPRWARAKSIDFEGRMATIRRVLAHSK